jgi:DNA-binding NarL/FixJ family response regulator
VEKDQVMVVHGDAELVERAGHLFDSARSEFVCAARDLNTWANPTTRLVLKSRLRSSASCDHKKLYSPLVLADEKQRDRLRQVMERGAQVRISGSPLPHETIIIDRRVMILAGRQGPGGREYSVTTAQTLVDGVHALFSAAWEAATDLGSYFEGQVPHLDDASRTILRALGAGLTDEAAARRLGLSLRTYRRRVAEIMETLDAGSRFQAGLRAGTLGIA